MAEAKRDPRWDALQAPFPPDWIEKLPKLLQKGDQRKGRCREGTDEGRYVSADGYYCGGWHARSVHLDYVGHAGITMRLNDAVGPENWSWEPLVTNELGLPVADRGEFWIKLTILGVTKLGVGDDFNGSMKQAIGDALRNAAMRFGIGTYLWSKSEAAHNLASNAEQPTPPAQPLAAAPPPDEEPETSPTHPEAQALADAAKRVRSYNSLRNLHGEANRKHLLNAPVAHPLTAQIVPLSTYLLERKADFENEPPTKESA